MNENVKLGTKFIIDKSEQKRLTDNITKMY